MREPSHRKRIDGHTPTRNQTGKPERNEHPRGHIFQKFNKTSENGHARVRQHFDKKVESMHESPTDGTPPHSAVAKIFPTLVFCLAAATIMATQLFRHPVISIADNTDFGRISKQVGIQPVGPYPQGFFKYAHVQFPIGKPERNKYASTELLLCSIARTLNTTFYRRDIFDIRFLGFVHFCAYLASLYLLACSIRLRLISKVIFLALMLFTLLDDRITSYFNTFYCESASVIFLVLTVSIMLTLYPAYLTRKTIWFRLLSFLACSLLLSYSKAQHLILLIPLWCFGMCVAWSKMISRKDRHAWAVASAFLMLGGLWFGIESRAFAGTQNTNIRIVLAEEIRPHSPDYEKDLREMHATKNDISRVTLGRIGLFYARHPKRYWQLLERRAAKAFQHIPYGSFTEEASRSPWEQSSKFNIWWHFKQKHFPKYLWFIFGTLAISALFGAYNYLKGPGKWRSHLGLVCTTLSIMTVCAYLIASTFEANGPEKHLFLFNILFDLVIAFSLLPAALSLGRLVPLRPPYTIKRGEQPAAQVQSEGAPSD